MLFYPIKFWKITYTFLTFFLIFPARCGHQREVRELQGQADNGADLRSGVSQAKAKATPTPTPSPELVKSLNCTESNAADPPFLSI